MVGRIAIPSYYARYSSIAACVIVAAVTFLLSRCLGTIVDTHRLMGFMKYAVEMGSGTMIPSFMKAGSGILKLIWEDTRHRDSKQIA
jgi:hypothetical protein